MTIYTSKDRTPYTYFISWNDLNLNYYGRRTANRCSPEEFFVSYFTSSKYVSDIIAEFGMPDVIKIHKIFSDIDSCKIQEEKFLKRVNAAKSLNWLNQTNGDRKFDYTCNIHTKATRLKISKANTGRIVSNETRAKISMISKGKPKLDEHIAKISVAKKGKKIKPCSDERKAKLSIIGKNQKQSIETRLKRSITMKGRVSPLRSTTQSIETRLKRSITMKGIPKPKFFSIISTKKSYDKGNLSKYFPELKKYY